MAFVGIKFTICTYDRVFQERIFQCWFNTFFVQQEGITKANIAGGQKPRFLTLEMAKKELDKANKDKDNKIYKPDFKVSIFEVSKTLKRIAHEWCFNIAYQ